MAEMQVKESGGGKGGKVRAKKMSTRIDFTPMVDLGFLLITFFMLTTTLTKSTSMDMYLPEDVPPEDLKTKPKVKEGKVITLLLGPNDVIYYYNGITDPKLDSTYFRGGSAGSMPKDLNTILREKKKFVYDNYVNEKGERDSTETIVLIKPTKTSRYKNFVDVLDEMYNEGIKRYVLMDVSKAEEDFIANPAGGLKYNPTENPQ